MHWLFASIEHREYRGVWLEPVRFCYASYCSKNAPPRRRVVIMCTSAQRLHLWPLAFLLVVSSDRICSKQYNTTALVAYWFYQSTMCGWSVVFCCVVPTTTLPYVSTLLMFFRALQLMPTTKWKWIHLAAFFAQDNRLLFYYLLQRVEDLGLPANLQPLVVSPVCLSDLSTSINHHTLVSQHMGDYEQSCFVDYRE